MQTLATPDQAADWLQARLPAGAVRLQADSRAVQPGDAFLAWPGRTHDARAHAGAALAAGAVACLVEAEGAAAVLGSLAADARVAALPGLKAAAGAVASRLLGHPSARLAVLAVTGTNGKTSSAWWLAQALAAAGRPCGLVGTLGVGVPPAARGAGSLAAGDTDDVDPALGRVQPTGLTSPDALTLHTALRDFVDQGLAACALEASSIGLVEHRLAGLQIAVALFTNFTRDHLDYHGSMTAYWAAKRSLFAWPGLQAAVVNIDDPQGAALAVELAAEATVRDGGPALWTVSRQGPARLQARHAHQGAAGLAFDLVEAGQALPVATALVGDYNLSNLLGVAAGLRALGLPLAEVAALLPRLTPVPGRLQPAGLGIAADVEVLVDYAHTPDALEKALQALRPLAQARGGRLVCVFGCGGNRDATKRPLMGAIAERQADVVVLTSDNPRHEQPEAILADILAGLSRPAAARVQADRRAAIAQAVAQAQPGDVLLLAGKGHEDTQEVAGVKLPFSDLAEARAALQRRAGVPA